MRILILGASGLIGNNIFKYLSASSGHEVFGTYRNLKCLPRFDANSVSRLIQFELNESIAQLSEILCEFRPDVIINALGITKHIEESIENIVRVNSLFPHQLAALSSRFGVKLVHISTDCVFSGENGMYSEFDLPDSRDLYGRSKILGEVTYGGHLTVRISTIGLELASQLGLLEWFLKCSNSCVGYAKAIFSGLPSKYFGYVLHQFILPNLQLSGLYHISSEPIDKFSLLKALADFYNKKIDIIPDESVVINRSLDSSSFTKKTGFVAPSWKELINDQWL